MKTLRPLHRNLVVAALGSFLVGASSVHCGSGASKTTGSGALGTGAGQSSGTNTGGSTTSSGVGGGGSALDAGLMDSPADHTYASDPPPTSCDAGGMPPPVSGTPECPSDKNLPGCPCSQQGQAAACWTGLRQNRGHGACQDGMTTCVPQGGSFVWGPCDGEVLPVTGGTGKAACACFSGGHWAIANLSPCFVTDASGNLVEAIATDATTMQCPFDFSMAPASWSTDTLTTDCTGMFTLCYTIKAGDPKNPQGTDCVVARSCTTAHYPVVNQVFTMPDLPGWITSASQTACAQQFYDMGGYGEMSVSGQSDECEVVDRVFQQVTYCAQACADNPDAGGCAGCMPGGGGSF